jgi:uncharacterized damage-inducible protein DinB
MLEAILELYAYSAWANARILETAGQLTREQFTTQGDGSDSIRDTLVHTASAQWLWLERWRGTSPAELWDPIDFPDVTALRTRWDQVEEATSDYLGMLRESELVRVVSYVNFQGETWAYPLWQQLLHQVNHATQHRSEAALLLTRLGYSPGWLDLLVYVDSKTARRQDGKTARRQDGKDEHRPIGGGAIF